MTAPIRVIVQRDSETDVWYVIETNIPGLVAEDASLEALIKKVEIMAGELGALNDRD